MSLSEGTSIQVKAIPDIELSSNRDSFDRQQQNDGPSGMHSSSESAKDDKMKTNNNIEYGNIDFYTIRFKSTKKTIITYFYNLYRKSLDCLI